MIKTFLLHLSGITNLNGWTREACLKIPLTWWTENYDHWYGWSFSFYFLFAWAKMNRKGETGVSLNIDISHLYLLFTESLKLNIMWQQPRHIVEYTSIYSKTVVPTQAKTARIFFFITKNESWLYQKYPSVYMNALHVMLGKVQFVHIQFQSLETNNLNMSMLFWIQIQKQITCGTLTNFKEIFFCLALLNPDLPLCMFTSHKTVRQISLVCNQTIRKSP